MCASQIQAHETEVCNCTKNTCAHDIAQICTCSSGASVRHAMDVEAALKVAVARLGVAELRDKRIKYQA